jgi:FkbM family methyltransferase
MTMTTLKQDLRYISRFGLGAGLQAARLRTGRGSLVRLRIPGIAHPVWARRGTSDVATFDEVFVAREYQLPFPDFAPRHALDLGANVGYASVAFAARWPEARILAVEPSGQNLALLNMNIRPWRHVVALQAAVWSQPARVRIANPGAPANAYRMSESASPEPDAVPAYTVDQLIARLGCERLGLLKMDIEGAEAEIFRHAAGWLDQVDVLLVELHDRLVPGCGQALGDALRGRRFRQEIVGANLAFDFR